MRYGSTISYFTIPNHDGNGDLRTPNDVLALCIEYFQQIWQRNAINFAFIATNWKHLLTYHIRKTNGNGGTRNNNHYNG